MLKFRLRTLLCLFVVVSILLVANTRPRYSIIGDIYDEPLPSDKCVPCDRHNWPFVCGAEFGWPWVYRLKSLKEVDHLPFDHLQRQRAKPSHNYEDAHDQGVDWLRYFDRFDWPNLIANIGLGFAIVIFSGAILERIKIVYLLSALVVCGFTYFAYQLHCAQVQARNIQWLQDQGVEIHYDTGDVYDEGFVSHEKPAVSIWLVMLVGQETAHSLIHRPSRFVVTEDTSEEIYDRIVHFSPNPVIDEEELADDEAPYSP